MFGVVGAIKFLISYFRSEEIILLRVRQYGGRVWLRPRSSDIRVAYEIFNTEELAFEWPLDRPPERIIDAGANVGYTSLALKKRWPDAKIVALEPDPENFAIALLNCKGIPAIELRQQGVWVEPMRLTVKMESQAHGAWALSFEPADMDNPQAVDAVSIDQLMKSLDWDSCDLVKMDIEGAEVPILKGDLAWLRPVRALLVEPHGEEAHSLIFSTANKLKMKIRQEGEKYLIYHP